MLNKLNATLFTIFLLGALGLGAMMYFGVTAEKMSGEKITIDEALDQNPDPLTDSNLNVQTPQYLNYQNLQTGLGFNYRASPDGYIVEEKINSDTAIDPKLKSDLITTLTLIQAKDAGVVPEAGEMPPNITIKVFANTKKQSSSVWAEANIQHSNIGFKVNDTSEAVLGGANAIRFLADGLYISDNAIVANGNNVYVISGMFLEETSAIRQDFQPLLDSIVFF